MNFRLIVALCCLAAAVQARPKTETSQNCALSCVSSSWLGFESGSAYDYDLQQEILLNSDLSTKQQSLLKLNSSVRIEAHNDCEMVMTMKVTQSAAGSSLDSLNPRETPEQVLAAVRQPVRFAIENGRISQICPSDKETRTSLNMKRAVLSQLQISVGQRGQAKQMQEDDILGSCWTEYSPEGRDTIIKTKDLSTCKLSYQVYPLTGVKFLDQQKPVASHKVMQGSLKCRVKLQENKDIIKESICLEEQQHSTDGTKNGAKEFVRVQSILKLRRQSDEISSVLTEIEKRTDLKHQHKSNADCQSSAQMQDENLYNRGSECIEKIAPATGKTSDDFKNKAKSIVEEICEQTQKQSVQRYTAQKYSELIKFLRGITQQEDFNEFFNWATTEACQGSEMISSIVMSAIPTVGTKQSFSLIIDEISQMKLTDKTQSKWLMNGIAYMKHPTSDLLPGLLDFVSKRMMESQSFVEQADSFALSAMTHKICESQEDCESDVNVKRVIDFFSEMLGEQCENLKQDSEKATVALLSIGNLGRVKGGAQTLIKCAKNNELQMANRVFSLQSLRRFSQLTELEIEQLISILQNSSEDSELRIVAYRTLTRLALTPRSPLLDSIRQILDSHKDDEQVQFYIYTHLKNQKNSAKQLVSSIVADRSIKQRMNKLSRRQYSNNFQFSYNSAAAGYGADVESNLLFSTKSAVPRFANLNLTVNNPSNGQSVNLLEVGLRMEGLETFMKQFYDSIAEKFDSSSSRQRSRRSVSSELSSEQQQHNIEAVEPRIDLLIRQYGVQTSHMTLNSQFLKMIPSIVSSSNRMELLSENVKDLVNFNDIAQSAGTLNEETVAVPTSAGVPILIKQETHYITNMQIKNDVKFNSQKKLEAELEIKPAAAVHTARVFSVDAVFQRAGIETNTNAITNTGVKLILQKDFSDSSDSQFSFKVQPLEKKQSVADVKTDVSFFSINEQNHLVKKQLKMDAADVQQIDKCTGKTVMKYTGHKICIVGRFSGSDSVIRSLRQRPGFFQVFFERSSDFGEFETTFRLVNKPKTRQLLVLIGDKKSTDRQLQLNLLREVKDTITIVKAEAINPIFPLRLNFSATQESESQKIKADAQIGQSFYQATATMKQDLELGVQLQGSVYGKDYRKPKLDFSLSHKFEGLAFGVLPKASTQIKLSTDKKEELTLMYNATVAQDLFFWEMQSSFKHSDKKTSSLQYRVKYYKSTEEALTTAAFKYDVSASLKEKHIFGHSLHTILKMEQVEGSPKIAVVIAHSLSNGNQRRKSPIDFYVKAEIKDLIKDMENLQFGFNGQITYQRNQQQVTTGISEGLFKLGQSDDSKLMITKVRTAIVSFSTQNNQDAANVKLQLRFLPVSDWSLKQQLIDLEILASSTIKGQESKNQLQISHVTSLDARFSAQKLAVVAQSQNLMKLSHETKVIENQIMSSISMQTIYTDKLSVTNSITKPKQQALRMKTTIERNSDKIASVDQQLELVSNDQSHTIDAKAAIEIQDSKFDFTSSTTVSRETVDRFIRFAQYQFRMYSASYNLQQSLRLFTNFVRVANYHDKFTLTGPATKQRLTMEVILDSLTTNGPLFKTDIMKSDDTKTDFNYDVTVERQSTDQVQGLKLKITANENQIETLLKRSVTNGNQIDYELKSEDSWDLHKIDLQLQMLRAEVAKYQMQLNGHVMQNRIDTDAMTQIKSSESSIDITTVIDSKATKSKLEVSFSSDAQKLQSLMKFNCDCTALKVKDLEMQLTTERSSQIIKAELLTKLEDQDIVALQLNLQQQKVKLDIRTPLIVFREAGFVATWTRAENDFLKLDAQVKVEAFGKSILIKQSGKARAAIDDQFFINVAMETKMELQGLEDLVKQKSLQTQLLMKVRRNCNFELEVKAFETQDAPMLLLQSRYSKFDSVNAKPLKVELVIETNYQTRRRYSTKLRFDSNSFIASLQAADKKASIDFSCRRADKLQTVKLAAAANIFSDDASEKTIGSEIAISAPFKLSDFEIKADVTLPLTQLQKVEVQVQNGEASRFLVEIERQGQKQKVIEAELAHKGSELSNIEGVANLYADLKSVLPISTGIDMQLKYEKKSQKLDLDLSVKQISDSQQILQAKIFQFETPKRIDLISEQPAEAGIVLKSADLLVYLAAFPQESGKELKALCKKGDDELLRLSAKTGSSVTDIRSGDMSIKGMKFTMTTEGVENGIKFTMQPKAGQSQAKQVVLQVRPDVYDVKIVMEAEQKNMLQVRYADNEIAVKYGAETEPNVLSITYSSSPKSQLKVSHSVKPINAARKIFSSTETVNVFNDFPFEITASWKNLAKKLELSISTDQKQLLHHTHDVTDFPRVIRVDTKVKNSASEKVWDLMMNFESQTLAKSQLKSELPRVYSVEADIKSFAVAINDVMRLAVNTQTEASKGVKVEFVAPLLKLNNQVTVEAAFEEATQTMTLIAKVENVIDMKSNIQMKQSPKLQITADFDAERKSDFLSWTGIQKLRVSSGIEAEAQAEKYMLTFDHEISADDQQINKLDFTLNTKKNYLPLEGELTSTGYVKCTASFKLDRQDESKSLQLNIEKIADDVTKRSLTIDLGAALQQSVSRNFHIELQTPKRLIVVSKQATEDGEVTTKLYLDKQTNAGITVTYKLDSESDKNKLQLDIELPTRKLALKTELKSEDRKHEVEVKFAYDAEKSPSKSINLFSEVDFSDSYKALLQLEAPFLNEAVRFEVVQQQTESSVKVRAEAFNGEDNRIAADFEISTEAADGKTTFILKTSGSAEQLNSQLSVIVRSKINDQTDRKELNAELRLAVPSKSFEKTVKLVYIPMQQLSLACDQGSSLSIMRQSNQVVHKVVLFASDNNKRASRFTVRLDLLKTLISAEMETGMGFQKIDSDLRQPTFKPEQKLVTASAGITAEGKRLHAAVFVGKMMVGQKLDFEDVSEVPRDLYFVTAGLRLKEKSQIKYFTNWRLADADQVNAAFDFVKTPTLRMQSAYNLLTMQSAVIDGLNAAAEVFTANIEAGKLVEELRLISSNDIDRLHRFVKEALEQNDFYIADIYSATKKTVDSMVASLQQIYESVSDAYEQMLDRVADIKEQILIFVEDLEVNELVQQAYAAIDSLWKIDFSGFMKQLRRSCEQISELVMERVEKMDAALRKLCIAMNGNGYTGQLNEWMADLIDRIVSTVSARKVAAGVSQVTSAIISEVYNSMLKPFIVRHISDMGIMYNFYNELLLETRIWYDTDATIAERQALSSVMQGLEYLQSADGKMDVSILKKTIQLLAMREFAQAGQQLLQLSTSKVTEYRPDCDAACRNGDTFATVQGTMYMPVYISSFSPKTLQTEVNNLQAPQIVLRRVISKVFQITSDGYALSSIVSDFKASGFSILDPIARLLAMKHRTAVIMGDNHLITFDGVSIQHSRPCNYVIAHDFQNRDFTVLQTYKKDSSTGQPKRDQLVVKFGNAVTSINRDGVFKINGETKTLPVTEAVNGRVVEATTENRVIEARFHDSVKNILVLRCSLVTDSCVVKVHPLYHGKVAGLAGSNDGRKSNDVSNSADSHMQLWTAGTCSETEAAPATLEATSQDSLCQQWFQQDKDSFGKCYGAVAPQSFNSLCLQYKSAGKDVCKVATLYIKECRIENVNVNTPRECIRCRLSSGKEITHETVVSDKKELSKMMQVVFLLENSACVKKSVTGQGRLRNLEYLATLIDNLPNREEEQSVEFGLATFGSNGTNAGPHAHMIGASTSPFGDLYELRSSLDTFLQSESENVKNLDSLTAISKLSKVYEWEPLAQKHVILLTCQQCTGQWKSGYGPLNEAFKAIENKLNLHVISKHSIPVVNRENDWRQMLIGYSARLGFYADRSSDQMLRISELNGPNDCNVELAINRMSKTKGSVWSLQEFAKPSRSNRNSRQPIPMVARQLVQQMMRPQLMNPSCKQCDCALSELMSAMPRCHIVRCPSWIFSKGRWF